MLAEIMRTFAQYPEKIFSVLHQTIQSTKVDNHHTPDGI